MSIKQRYNSQPVLKKLAAWLLPAVELQLFITLCALPLLVAWGFPISCMTIVGNLLFAPVLSLFILLATFLCVAALFNIQVPLLAAALQYVTNGWCNVLNYGSTSWLIYNHERMLIPSLIFLFSAFLILHTRLLSQVGRVIALMSLLTLACVTSYVVRPRNVAPFTINCGKGVVHAHMRDGELIITDPGSLARMQNAASWIRCTLLPTLAKRCGTVAIADFYERVANCHSYKALAQLCAQVPIKRIHVARICEPNEKQVLYLKCLQKVAKNYECACIENV